MIAVVALVVLTLGAALVLALPSVLGPSGRHRAPRGRPTHSPTGWDPATAPMPLRRSH